MMIGAAAGAGAGAGPPMTGATTTPPPVPVPLDSSFFEPSNFRILSSLALALFFNRPFMNF